MKKIIFLTIMFLLMTAMVWAGTKTLEFTWMQGNPEEIAGWNIYMAVDGNDYTDTPMFNINKTGDQTEYTSDQMLISPDGEEHTYRFKITSVDVAGNESFYSNEASIVIDLENNSVPYSFTVKIKEE